MPGTGDTGEVGGHTVVITDPLRPTAAFQADTAVARSHRGHRLGLLLKIDMMRWLAEADLQVEVIETWNNVDNDFMIKVNEALGYRLSQVYATLTDEPLRCGPAPVQVSPADDTLAACGGREASTAGRAGKAGESMREGTCWDCYRTRPAPARRHGLRSNSARSRVTVRSPSGRMFGIALPVLGILTRRSR